MKGVGDNMKILVLSDSHRRVANILTAVEREKPDMVFHLGDMVQDSEELSYVHPKLPLYRVEGNCDTFSTIAGVPSTLLQSVGGLRFLLTHGHLYNAKHGSSALLREGRTRSADAVLYGHTHVPVAAQEPDGLWLINPGTIGGVGNRATYGVLLVENRQLTVEIKGLAE